jgi:hypothetical protein
MLLQKIALIVCYSRKSQNAPAFARFTSGTELKFIGRDALNTWLHRSSHITPPDFFFWDHIKGTVYVPPLPSTLPELPARIRAVAPTFTPAMLTNVPTATGIKVRYVLGYSKFPH